MSTGPWSDLIRLSELRGTTRRKLEADAGARARIAKALGVLEVLELTGQVEATPWLDGVKVTGEWTGRVSQTCGVTLDPFESKFSGEFTVRAVPAGSPAAPTDIREVELDLSSEDPPDVLEDEGVDVAGYLVEHLALELDPYPRKPGVEWEAPPEEREASPFAVLQKLKEEGRS
jgi:uncharacterized metal-binding protein YceD (DUF177 family)